MKDKTLLLSEAMGYIDERFIEEAHAEARGVPYQIANRRRTIRQIAAVACLCIVAIGVFRLSSPESFDKLSGNMAPEANAPMEDLPLLDSDISDGNAGNAGNTEEKYPSENEAPPESPNAPPESPDADETDTEESESETET